MKRRPGRQRIGRKTRNNDLINFNANKKAQLKFYSKREKILARDGWKCTYCGKSELENFQEFKRSLDVHHINGNPEDNRESNLEAICCRCHHRKEPNRDWVRYGGVPVEKEGDH